MRNIYEPFQRRFRPSRLRLFYSTFTITKGSKVLDLGGGPYFWDLARREGFPVPQVTVLNIRPGPAQLPSEIKWVLRDAKDTELEDFSFDIVFSNSLVEHLVDWDSQVQFASEVKRLARNHFIQTPNRWFFVEPHFVTPVIHWLPKKIRHVLGPKCTVWGWASHSTRGEYQKLLHELRLLSVNEMRTLFPDSELILERFFGFTKSIIAVRSQERT